MNEDNKKGKGNLVIVIAVVLAIGLVLSSVGYGIALSDKNNLKEKYDRVKENYDTVNSSYNSLQSDYNSLNERYNSLQTNHTNLKQNYNSLQSNYSSLSSQYASVQQNYNTLQGSYATIQSQYNALQSNYHSLQSQYNSLQSNYNSLQSQYNSLQSNYSNLESEYNTLQNKYDTLNSSYVLLQSSYSNLQSNYTQLNNSYSSLQSDYNGLESQFNLLQSNYTGLQNDYNALQSNYNSLQSNYNSLQSQYNSLNNSYNSLQSDFTSYKQKVEIRYGWGKNATHFVTPNNPDVIAYKNDILSLYETPSDGILSWDDIDAIFDWIWWDTWYNYDTYIDTSTGYFYGEFWQYPNETLANIEDVYGWFSLGDCEDFTVLMASLCKAEENVNTVWCAEVTLINNSIEYPHACIFVDDGNLMRIYDPTNNYTSGGGLSEQVALHQYTVWWGVDSIRVDAIFNENQYIEFNSNIEFFTFF